MRQIKEDNKLLASLAVFRELYNAEKDVYGIISIFLSDVIKINGLYSFNINEITEKLNSTFDFEIPVSVVKTSLGRLKYVQKLQTEYIVNDISKIKTQDVDEKQHVILLNNDTIINSLFKFIENETKEILTNIQKEEISDSFYCFLLDLNDSKDYFQYISAFILNKENDIDFKNQLNLIREGVILYSGIKYNNNLNDLGSWKTELTIYIETEILFHIAGFNGELCKTLATDFLTYVKEINNKAQKKLIKLKYFQEVKNEIEGFFTKARYILDGNDILNPNITAMGSILNGCRTPSDLIEKKSDFYSLLKFNSIEEDTYQDYFSPANYKYNIVDSHITEKVSLELERDASDYLKFLNYISIHRKELNTNNFENIGTILLTGNSTTLKVAWNDLVRDDNSVPLATYLNFLTNKFWFKLNKGFGKNSVPKSFDIITKSQIVLSSILNDNVGKKFNELQTDFKSGKITEEQAKARIINLRNQVRKPEEIREDTITDILNTINEDSLEKFIQEQTFQKIKAEKEAEQNVKLRDELENKKNVETELIKTKQDLLKEKKSLLTILIKQQKPLDKKAKLKRLFRIKIQFLFFAKSERKMLKKLKRASC